MKTYNSLLLITTCAIIILLVIALRLSTPDALFQIAQPSDWLGFLGNIITGAMTLIAAGIAWLAVQEQIESTKAIALHSQTDAWLAVKNDLINNMLGINLFWKSVDQALLDDANLKVRDWRHASVIEYFNYLPDKNQIENYNLAKANLGTMKSRSISIIVSIFVELDRSGRSYMLGPTEHSDPYKWRRRQLEAIRRYLTILAKQITQLDADVGSIFIPRAKSELDNTSLASRYETLWKETMESERSIIIRTSITS